VIVSFRDRETERIWEGEVSRRFPPEINDHWTICFEWRSGNAVNVEITDYHD